MRKFILIFFILVFIIPIFAQIDITGNINNEIHTLYTTDLINMKNCNLFDFTINNTTDNNEIVFVNIIISQGEIGEFFTATTNEIQINANSENTYSFRDILSGNSEFEILNYHIDEELLEDKLSLTGIEKLPGGIYTIHLTLLSDDQILSEWEGNIILNEDLIIEVFSPGFEDSPQEIYNTNIIFTFSQFDNCSLKIFDISQITDLSNLYLMPALICVDVSNSNQWAYRDSYNTIGFGNTYAWFIEVYYETSSGIEKYKSKILLFKLVNSSSIPKNPFLIEIINTILKDNPNYKSLIKSGFVPNGKIYINQMPANENDLNNYIQKILNKEKNIIDVKVRE